VALVAYARVSSIARTQAGRTQAGSSGAYQNQRKGDGAVRLQSDPDFCAIGSANAPRGYRRLVLGCTKLISVRAAELDAGQWGHSYGQRQKTSNDDRIGDQPGLHPPHVGLVAGHHAQLSSRTRLCRGRQDRPARTPGSRRSAARTAMPPMAMRRSPHSRVRPELPRNSKQAFEVDVMARVDRTWGLAILPDGRALISIRAGGLRIIDQGGVVSEPLAGSPVTPERPAVRHV